MSTGPPAPASPSPRAGRTIQWRGAAFRAARHRAVIFTPAVGALFSSLRSGAFIEHNAMAPAFAVAGLGSTMTTASPYVTLGLSHAFTSGDSLVVTPTPWSAIATMGRQAARAIRSRAAARSSPTTRSGSVARRSGRRQPDRAPGKLDRLHQIPRHARQRLDGPNGRRGPKDIFLGRRAVFGESGPC